MPRNTDKTDTMSLGELTDLYYANQKAGVDSSPEHLARMKMLRSEHNAKIEREAQESLAAGRDEDAKRAAAHANLVRHARMCGEPELAE